ncbi:putative zinc metalloprotease NCU04133 [Bombardia bombarda]|uniref:Peptide hydrolase n=1 Tax=Bombardia bombarda TaxID=252184 RepID=A0AA39XKK5_9PEZI|nr:putative zinc metalloprotease NCU04133 [Bombardia bombarda]
MLNPISFRPGPVTFWTTLVYLALLIPIVIINENAPPAPSESPFHGVNLTEAWLDLTTITAAYHPYNSHFNDDVRNILLQRVASILDQNGVSWNTEGSGSDDSHAAVTVFNDMQSNVSLLMSPGPGSTNALKDTPAAQAAYFEGQNILVYIRGKQDDQGSWWNANSVDTARRNEKGLTLVNAHIDSVSTGFGATDDGMGVVTCLQTIKYFSHPDHQPERGIVVMLNNGEEDFLYGARAFGQSPLAPFIHTFVNLEGAGAGGRALAFRSTDLEVTAAYAGTSDPFGTILTSDAFGLGFVRSGTDYSVLHDIYGERGLDVAFYKPRARYHTNQDDAKHSSRNSLWHMISAAIHTTEQLSGDTGDTFTGPRADGARGKVANGSPSDGVWFDIFGKGFVIFGLRGMFAWSLTVLVATPLILILLTYILHKLDKYYFFTSSVRTYDHPDYEPVAVGGFKGLFRFPFALSVAGALTLGAAFLMRKVNPFIIYSSPYSVWAMNISLFYFTFWAIMRGANFARPSALHRGYVNIWLFVIGWAILVAVTVTEDRLRLGAGYPFVFFQSAVFLTTFISLCELFSLPKKTAWGQQVREDHEARDHLDHLLSMPPPINRSPSPQLPAIPRHESLGSPRARRSTASTSGPGHDAQNDEEDSDQELPNERTPLVGGGNATGDQIRTTFATTYRRSISALVNGAHKFGDDGDEPFEHEQLWSGRLPSWAWFFQFLLLGPFMIILVGQLGLLLTDAVNQTGADGSNVLLPYLVVFAFTILLFLPLAPFIHRVTHHIPVFLLVVFVATFIYNLAAFPFSAENRYKAYFLQTIDLDTGDNRVCYSGLEEYIRQIVAELPSASGKEISCGTSRRLGLTSCCYDGSAVPPHLSDELPAGVPPEEGYADLVSINITRNAGNSARIEVNATNTKACFVKFKSPISGFEVQGGSGWDDRFGQYPELGVDLIRLWRRDWTTPWVVDIEWKDADKSDAELEQEWEKVSNEIDPPPSWATSSLGDGELKARASGLDGFVICMWADANRPGDITALDEGLKYSPPWAALTKTAEGLVEGSKSFKI